MSHTIQTGNLVKTLLAQLKQLFGVTTKERRAAAKPPKLEFIHKERIVKFGDHLVRLSPLLWALLIAVVESPGGVLDFLDSCDGKPPLCPWRKNAESTYSAKRSAASRLSIRLWERGIPYKIVYHHADNAFELVIVDKDALGTHVVCITSHLFFSVDTAKKLKAVVDALIISLPVLQKIAQYELKHPDL